MTFILEKIDLSEVKDTRKLIIYKSLEKFSKYGYEDVSITDIAKTINKSKSLIFYHFQSKMDLALSCVEEIFDYISKFHIEELNKEENTPEQQLETLIDFFSKILFQNPGIIKMVIEIMEKTKEGNKIEFKENFDRFFDIIMKVASDILYIFKKIGIPNPFMRMFIFMSVMDGLAYDLSYIERIKEPFEAKMVDFFSKPGSMEFLKSLGLNIEDLSNIEQNFFDLFKKELIKIMLSKRDIDFEEKKNR